MKQTYRFTFAHPIFRRESLVAQSNKYSKSGGVWYEDSIYYLWFCFLNISEEYNTICHNKGHSNKTKNQVYKDFADVRKYTFKYWFSEKVNKQGLTRGEYLFGAQRYTNVFETNQAINDSNNITLTIPLNLSKRSIAAEVKKIVNKHHKAVRGSNFKSNLQARYTPTATGTNPKIKALQKILLLKKMHLKHPNKTSKELWALCKQANKDFAKGDSFKSIEAQNSQVSRLLSRYNEIDADITLGVF